MADVSFSSIKLLVMEFTLPRDFLHWFSMSPWRCDSDTEHHWWTVGASDLYSRYSTHATNTHTPTGAQLQPTRQTPPPPPPGEQHPPALPAVRAAHVWLPPLPSSHVLRHSVCCRLLTWPTGDSALDDICIRHAAFLIAWETTKIGS